MANFSKLSHINLKNRNYSNLATFMYTMNKPPIQNSIVKFYEKSIELLFLR